MSTKNNWEIVEIPEKGRVLLATKDILPGTIIYFEEAILQTDGKVQLSKATEILSSYGYTKTLLDLFLSFHKLSASNQITFMCLFGPEVGIKAEQCRDCANEIAKVLNWTEAKTTKFVKFVMIYQFCGYGKKDGRATVYELCSYISHSCIPNAFLDFSDHSATCRSTQLIKSGEEITVSYHCGRDAQSVHERRTYYYQHHEFVCKCSRCWAGYDETRRFNCFNKTCSGCHLAGVIKRDEQEYLLPCSQCYQSASAEFEARMFEVERQLPSLAETLSKESDELQLKWNQVSIPQTEVRNFLSKLKAIEYPTCHQHGAALSLLIYKYTHLLPDHQDSLFEAVKVYINPFDHMMHFPNFFTSPPAFKQAAVLFAEVMTAESLSLAKHYAAKALRYLLILGGRKARDPTVDTLLASILLQLPHPVCCSTAFCMFCEESPAKVALTLSACGRCGQVAYCSKECQTAHWKVHKKVCRVDGLPPTGSKEC